MPGDQKMLLGNGVKEGSFNTMEHDPIRLLVTCPCHPWYTNGRYGHGRESLH